MKKLALFAIVCCTLVLSSCYRPQQSYNAAITDWHIANAENLVSTKAVISTVHAFWEGDYAYKGLTTDLSDLKAKTRFLESYTALLVHGSEITPYMAADDYFIYTLNRTTDGGALVMQVKVYVDANGNLAVEELYDNVTE